MTSAESQERLHRVLSAVVPATFAAIRRPAATAELHRAERCTGGWNWPDDVVSFYELCDGLDRTPDGYLFPGCRPMSLDEIVDTWESLLAAAHQLGVEQLPPGPERDLFFAQLAVDSDPQDFTLAPAGTPVPYFVASLLPVAEDQNGSYLMVDRRMGPAHGSLRWFDKVDGTLFSRQMAPSLDALIVAVIDALSTADTIMVACCEPVLSGCRLSWRHRSA